MKSTEKRVKAMGMGRSAAAAVFAVCLFGGTAGIAEEVSQSANYKMVQQNSTPVYSLPAVIAKVNGHEITTNQFMQRVLANAGDAVLTAMVDDILVEQEAERQFDLGDGSKKSKRKKSKAAAEIDSEAGKRLSDLKKQFPDAATFQQRLKNLGLSVEDLSRQIRLDLYREKLLADKTKVSPDEAKQYFENNRQQFSSPEQIHLKHILVSSEQESKDLLLALKVGANFELLAREKSIDTATRANGGDLGFFAAEMLMPEIRQAVLSLPAGETTTVKTGLGYHIIKVAEKKPAREAVWNADTRRSVELLLKRMKFNQQFPGYIQQLRAKSDIQTFINR